MKITRISLKDFRIYEQETVEFSEPLSIFKAGNHAGKTSIAQAIKLALSKCADGTDPRGAGALDKVRLGANKAIIETVIEGKAGLVTLTTQYGPGKTGRTQKIAASPANEKVEAGFDKYLDANQERLSCCLDAGYFTSQKPEQQKAILATLVLPTSYDFDPEMKKLAEQQLGTFLWGDNPVKVIDQVYEAAYSARRTAKATLAGIRVPNKPAPPTYTAEAVQEKLGKLRTASVKEAKSISGGGTVQIGRLEQSLEQAKEKLDELTEARESAVQRKGIEYPIWTGADLKAIEKRASARKLFDQLQEKINALRLEISQQFEAQAIYAELTEATCPTCTQPITRAFVKGKIDEHQRLAQEAEESIAGLLGEQHALGDIAGAEKELEVNAKRIQTVSALDAKIAEYDREIPKAQSYIQTLTAQLDQAKAQQAAPVDNSKLEAINKEIAEWEGYLAPAANYNAILEQITTSHNQWVAQKDVVDDLEVLCDYFGKDGIKAQLIAKHIGEFSDTVNSVLGAWGYSATFSFDPYEFIVSTATGNTLPLKSGSEKMMFAVALQTAIAFHGKIRMIVVDEADTFVDAERGRLFGGLKKLLDAGTLDQAIVFASDPGRTKIAKPGVATYWVEAGKVVAL
jgi:hypothetical protein